MTEFMYNRATTSVQRAATPDLSFVVPTDGDFSSLKRTIAALAAQTIRNRIELVVVTPRDGVEIPDGLDMFWGVTVVNGGPIISSNLSRIAGIRVASSAIVALGEDHCYPDPEWAEALLSAYAEDVAAVGPVFRTANPRSTLAWMNFLVEYGEWMEPAPRREAPEIAGHNSSYRRDLLLAYGDELETVFEVEGVTQAQLRAKGYRIIVEPKARTSHLNFSSLAATVRLRFQGSRLFAAYRAQQWTLQRRVLYTVGSPLIPVVRFVRIVRALAQTPEHRTLLPRVLPALAFGLVVSAIGELAGYVAGPGRSREKTGGIEFSRRRYLNASDRHDFDLAQANVQVFGGDGGNVTTSSMKPRRSGITSTTPV
ncbi:MAG TPA: glycosyltransferase [Gemmatimonadaceae bacterium]|nr:glycosyltransferase [Gemmatimonadaceae bacterium]